ncbi:MAG: GGDEF domain-containing protein [Pirellulaceae bacterium]
MLPSVIVLGILNLGLGYLLAYCWEPPSGWELRVPRRLLRLAETCAAYWPACLRLRLGGWGLPGPRKSVPRPDTLPTGRLPEERAAVSDQENTTRTRLSDDQVPPGWQEAVAEFPLQPTSQLEALLWTMRCRTIKARQQCLALHQQYLTEGASGPVGDTEGVLDAWHESLCQWSQWLVDACGDTAPWPRQVELTGHLATWREAVAGLRESWRTAPGEADLSERHGRALATVETLASLLHRGLQDIDTLLGTLLSEEGRLAETPENAQRDALAQTLSRLGLIVLLGDWSSRDTERVRMVSGVLVRIDGNRQRRAAWGNLVAEQCVVAIGAQLQNLVRKDRGFDRVARVQADEFLLFLGDTGFKNAINASERIRQTIAVTAFSVGAQHEAITVSCGVAEWKNLESASDWLTRLDAIWQDPTVRDGNQSYYHDGERTQRIPAGHYTAGPRTAVVPLEGIPLMGSPTPVA